jgi:acetyltransferase-like isoleucine patch superfamily enzyme
MISKFFKGLSFIRGLNMNLSYRLSKHHLHDKMLSIRVYRKVKGRIGKQVRITGGGNLDIGIKHKPDFFFQSLFSMADQAQLLLHGRFQIFTGCKVVVGEGACLELGSGRINNEVNITCYQHIQIGEHVAIGEGVTIRDSDGHSMLGHDHQMTRPIHIGNNVWIGVNTTILKGVTIGDGAVIAAGSMVNKDIPSKCLAGGVPAKVIRENIDWKY